MRLTLWGGFVLSILLGWASYAHGQASILSISVNPANPTAGSTATVTVTYCSEESLNGGNYDSYAPWFLIAAVSTSSGGKISECPAAGQTFLVYGNYFGAGDSTVTNTTTNGVPPASTEAGVFGYQCGSCSYNTSSATCVTETATFNITWPQLDSGTSYDLVGVVSDNSPNNGNGGNSLECSNASGLAQASVGFTEAPPAQSISISKEANQLSATAGVAGSQVLFTIYYTLTNDSDLVIKDTVPAGATLDAISPGGTASGSNLSWEPVTTNPDATVQGQVWFLVTLNSGDTMGQTLDNTASATSSGDTAGVSSNEVTATVDGDFTLSKSESATTASAGQDVTYTLSYTYNGDSLVFYDSYDNNAATAAATSILGSDGPYSILGTTPSWSIDQDSNGNTYLSNPGDGDYPSLLNENEPLGCSSSYIVQGNLMVDTDNTTGQDATMIIQGASNLQNMIEVGISADPSPGNLFLQITTNGTQTYPAASEVDTTPVIEGDWYTVVAQITFNANGSETISAKYWQTGTAEPTAWAFTYTDTAPPACTSGANYVGWQAQMGDSYTDLSVYAPLTADNTMLYDTVPTGLSFVSASNGGADDAGVVTWALGDLTPPASASVTWVGQVQGCLVSSITNSAQIEASNVSGVASNVVTLTVQACTPSDTVTDTPTNTPTATPTDTLTVTQTNTPTATPTFTQTDTPTSTESATPTQTITTLNTATDTPTVTATESDTPTATPSPTPTDTATVTATESDTATETDTSTETDTPTATPTYSDTPVDSPTDTPTVTATDSVTATETDTSTESSTMTLTATPTFTLTDTYTPTRTATETETDTDTATPTFTETDTATETLTPSATPSVTPSPTITQTLVLAPDQITITIYNSAGEVVRTLYSGSADFGNGGITLQSGAVASGGDAVLVFPGYILGPGGTPETTLSWDLTNNNGQAVASGVYTIQTTITNVFGQVTTLDNSVQVMNTQSGDGLTIYNSAGEVVALPQPLSPSALPLEGLSLGTRAYAPDYDPATGKAENPLVLNLVNTAGQDYEALWDGLNTQGQPVASGVYIAQLVYSAAAGGKTVINQPFTVIQGKNGDDFSGAVAAPDPVLGSELQVDFTPSPTLSVYATLYSLSGEAVARAQAPPGVGGVTFDVGRLATGVYLVRLEKLAPSQGALASAVLKVAVVH